VEQGEPARRRAAKPPGELGIASFFATPVRTRYRVDVPARSRRRAPPRGRTCALDLGRVRVGVAIDDELGVMAHPRGTLDGRDERALLATLRELADREDVVRFVVGYPLEMRGGEGPAAARARAMAQRIADATGRSVELWDERLTTVEAARSLRASGVGGRRARERIDEAAACTILQAWMEARRR